MTRNAWLVELARLLVAAQRDMGKARSGERSLRSGQRGGSGQ